MNGVFPQQVCVLNAKNYTLGLDFVEDYLLDLWNTVKNGSELFHILNMFG